ncbi:MAG: hypothetical protein E5Y51_02985 [Mesorhizobium sp.]|nr:MAG: hypothetical protein EOR19_31145 [Mesorhizobium sp.]TIN20403.1 MAG: hypothetical protein E5Y51_02985 [Mesorhizobium sp.]
MLRRSRLAREALMAWCEQNRVNYVFGVARNERLVTKIAPAWRKPAGGPRQVVRCTRLWRLSCGSRRRRAVAQAECTTLGANPRFIVSSSSQSAGRHGRFTSTRSHQRPSCGFGLPRLSTFSFTPCAASASLMHSSCQR